MFNLLVLGGSGFVGRSLCEKLVRRASTGGGRITVPSRQPAGATAIRHLPHVNLVQVDLYSDFELARLVTGADAVINLVAILHGRPADFQRVHVDLPKRLAQACRQAGVRRMVHVSALGVGPNAPSNYLESKSAGETVLTSAGLDLTLLRPSVIFGEHDRFINLFAQLQAFFPIMPLAGYHARFQPVWVDDVAQAIVNSLDDPRSIGQIIECAGPEVFELNQLVRQAGQWAEHRRPVLPLPHSLAWLQAWMMEHLPGEPLMSRDNLASMQVPNVASGTLPGLDRLGIRPMALAQVMPEVLHPRHGAAQRHAWRMRAGRD